MKTTLPNKDAMGSKSGSTSSSSGSMKEQKMKLEKELEDVNKRLGSNAKGKKNSDSELKLLERKVYIMLKLKQWKEVLEEGYKVLGKKGPDVIIYKCILVSLCRLGKFEDDVVELLNHWKTATPKCSQMSDTRRKMEGYLTAIRSGINASVLLQNVEEVLGLNSDLIFSNNSSTDSEPSWRFRPPPQRHNTFSICPRITSGSTCIYGDECLLAHSKEELKEWQFRSQLNGKKGNPDSLDYLRLSRSPQFNSVSVSSVVREPIPPTYRLLPPACMYYLLGLVKKIKDADNIKNVLVENLPDVKIKFTSSLELRKTRGMSAVVSHKWTFMIAAKQPLATVTLLHDVNRDHFGITGAFFFNSKKESMDLVEMHPNNKSQKLIQVLNTFIRPDVFLPFNNGWPEWCCYQVDVVFHAREPISAVYEQNIVFDFKNDPKVAKRLSVIIEPLKQPLQIQAVSVSTPCYKTSNCEASSDTDEENSIEEDLETMSEDESVKRIISPDYWGCKPAETVESNISIGVLKPRYDSISSDTTISSGKQLDHSRSESDSENSVNLNISVDDINLKRANCVSLMRKISLDNYQLFTYSKRKNETWIALDLKYLDVISDILREGLQNRHYNLLFPELLEPKPWGLSALMDELDHPKKPENNLNSKQKQAFCAIMKQSVRSKNPCERVPVIITGPSSSGKSYVIAHSVLAITASKAVDEKLKRVLICTYNNEAADQYVSEYFNTANKKSRMMDLTTSPLRIYYAGHSVQGVSEVVKAHCLLTDDGNSFRYPTIDEIFSHRIIIVTLSTCVELVQLGLPEDTFAHIIIDEATQMLEIESVCPIVLAGTNTNLVLAGDLNLLSTEIFSLEISSKMSHLSLIDRLNDLYPSNNPSRIKLQETYNKRKEIVQFVSNEFYNSSLVCAQPQPSHPRYFPLCFSAVLGGDDSIADTGESFFNMKEVLEIRDRLVDLIDNWPPSWETPKNNCIGVITSYAAQATGLQIRLKLDGLSFVDVVTVPESLVKQYRVVLISPVRTFKDHHSDNLCHVQENYTEYGFFTNRRAINTVLSRAQSLVIVVGDLVSLCNVGSCRDIWREYVSVCRRNGSIIGLTQLTPLTTDNAVQNVPAFPNKFEPSTYNIPPKMLNNPGPFQFLSSHKLSPFVGDFIEAGTKNITPTQNSINFNYENSPSQLKTKIREDTVKEVVIASKSNGNLSSIWDSLEDLGQGNGNKSSNASIWDNYPDITSLGSLTDLKSIWNTDVCSTANQNLQTNVTFVDSRIKKDVNSYRNPFNMPDVRLMGNVTPKEFLPTPITLPVPPYRSGSKQTVENCSNGTNGTSTHLRPNSLFGAISPIVGSNILQTKSATVMRPIGPPSELQGYQTQTYGNYDASSHDSFHSGARRHAYIPPPRMLRSVPQSALFENFNSVGFTKEPSKDFDFFSELGLNEGKRGKKVNSSSSSSSSQGSADLTGDSNLLLTSSTEFPQLTQPTDWVQVKSSKKPTKSPPLKQAQEKKSKKKPKTVCDIPKPNKESKELTVEQKIQGLMEMGFEKRQTIRALQACDKDLQRSVEWLILYAPTKKDQRATE